MRNVVAICLILSSTGWVQGLSILGGNQGPYGGHNPSLGEIGQLVDHVEDKLIGHDASDVTDNMVSRVKNFRLQFENKIN